MMFGFHWKHILLSSSLLDLMSNYLSLSQSYYEDSSSYLGGWFRDYLWFNSSYIISGYSSSGCTDIFIWSWIFLLAHFWWAVSLIFLISWRGYWQEIIDILIHNHLTTPPVWEVWSASSVTPLGLSIVQARSISLDHFASGLILTYASPV